MNRDAGIDAAISAFIRHPELSSIKYEGKNNIISLEMILKGYIDEQQKQEFIHKTYQALTLFHKLRKISINNIKLEFIVHSDICILTLIRDDISLCEEEIDLYLRLTDQDFSSVLLREMDEELVQDQIQRDVKNTIMKKINNSWNPEQKLIAYRDRGKMFVFDK